MINRLKVSSQDNHARIRIFGGCVFHAWIYFQGKSGIVIRSPENFGIKTQRLLEFYNKSIATSRSFDRGVTHVAANRDEISLIPRRSLLTRCPREVWERAGERTFSVNSRRVSLGDVTAHGRVQDRPSQERLGTRLGWDEKPPKTFETTKVSLR